ncbi:unnamed protein product [marine sediment metagenome]|uniref:Uncharacterized protein n=1 Tax=marine sediment metagenome TaxID=412755 RepID=X0VBU1_9ZZZZ
MKNKRFCLDCKDTIDHLANRAVRCVGCQRVHRKEQKELHDIKRGRVKKTIWKTVKVDIKPSERENITEDEIHILTEEEAKKREEHFVYLEKKEEESPEEHTLRIKLTHHYQGIMPIDSEEKTEAYMIRVMIMVDMQLKICKRKKIYTYEDWIKGLVVWKRKEKS